MNEAPIKYPVGYSDGHGGLKIAVIFPKSLFDNIIAMAKREKKTFNHMVVELVTVGKLDLDESDALEPPAPAPRGRGTAAHR